MIEILKRLLTSSTFLTVVSGVLVFLFGQLFNEYFLKPIQKYKELKARIAYAMTYNAKYYSNPIKNTTPNENYNNASAELSKLAAEVDAMIELNPLGNVFIPSSNRLTEVSKSLIGLSNGLCCASSPAIESDMNQDYVLDIYCGLKLKSRGIYKEKKKYELKAD